MLTGVFRVRTNSFTENIPILIEILKVSLHFHAMHGLARNHPLHQLNC